MDLQTVRVKELWHLAGVFYVRTESMAKGFNIPLDREFAEDSPDADYVLLLDNGFPIATCRLKMVDARTGKIERVCVLPLSRGINVGRRLIADAEVWLMENGATKIVISSRDEVVGFYEKLGYTADWTRTKDGFFKEVYTEKIL